MLPDDDTGFTAVADGGGGRSRTCTTRTIKLNISSIFGKVPKEGRGIKGRPGPSDDDDDGDDDDDDDDGDLSRVGAGPWPTPLLPAPWHLTAHLPN